MVDSKLLVTLNSGRSFLCDSKDTILHSALKSKVALPYSCSNGRCGACKTILLHGEITEIQEQIGLTPEDRFNKSILTCCCSPKTEILIDAEDLSILHDIDVKTLPARINTIKKLTPDIIQVTLRLPPTSNFKFLEGQFLDVIWNNLRRSYSIASTIKNKEITLLIRRFENGKMSNYWFNQAKENDLLRIEGPKGTFFFRDTPKPLLFLATGTGISPIMSILNSLDSNLDFIQRSNISIYWGNRYPEEFILHPKFKKLNVEFIKVISKPNQHWSGDVGYVQNIAIQKETDLAEFVVYACGSIAMIQSAKQKFIQVGVSEKQFYSDAFVQSF